MYDRKNYLHIVRIILDFISLNVGELLLDEITINVYRSIL